MSLERCPLHRKFSKTDKSNHNIIEHLRDKISADVCRVVLKITAIWHQISLGDLLLVALAHGILLLIYVPCAGSDLNEI